MSAPVLFLFPPLFIFWFISRSLFEDTPNELKKKKKKNKYESREMEACSGHGEDRQETG